MLEAAAQVVKMLGLQYTDCLFVQFFSRR